MGEYNLLELQKKEIDILQAVHNACEKMNIHYIIMHGTLIGAVRHHGFIPWDDDIDICMTQEDYDVFIREGQKYLPEHLRIQHYSTEEECPNLFAKVRDVNTTFLHKEHVDLNINQGIFIDVFPVGRIKSGTLSVSIEHYRRKMFNIINECFDEAYIAGIQRRSSQIIGKIIHSIIVRGCMRHIRRKDFLEREEDRRRKLHIRGNDCTFVSIYKRIIGPYSMFTKRKLYEFDGHQFYGPEDYDTLLRLLYGNYMQIPPKEQQVTHKPLFVDLEHGYSAKEALSVLKNNQKIQE